MDASERQQTTVDSHEKGHARNADLAKYVLRVVHLKGQGLRPRQGGKTFTTASYRPRQIRAQGNHRANDKTDKPFRWRDPAQR
ncbi:hypothetical protein GCM10011574_26010 [Microbispora bryophytorum]|uniref:Uncharacterized protein n=1 Tax=Microbispora bryophytorum TaxID=1460882 RepID=A0A8H9GY57_9ACTN|nr:hypothetical protein GCM10011574_26010 [Microbispora bryophytorum]